MSTPADAVHGMLTVLFALLAAHALRHGVRSPGTALRDRVDHLLHFAMAAAMAAMPWGVGHSLSGRTTVALFTAAAVWFPLTALHRRTRDGAGRTTDGAGRTANGAADVLHRLPPAVGMAAMAWMLRTSHGGAAHSHETLADGVPAAHHTAALGHGADASATAAGITGLLTVYLLACALRSLTRPMPSLRSATDTAHRAAATDPYGHVRDGAMALGTAVMLLMPH
ncbi:DUF5134 domain-containing protein [Streptomyces sp. NPDC059785]|uniref:DUF5134 domain-containing protein n=1 Tax=Streptomyces sp. NPDC059785 TaxID=3346945 RepID=UPI003667D4CC